MSFRVDLCLFKKAFFIFNQPRLDLTPKLPSEVVAAVPTLNREVDDIGLFHRANDLRYQSV